MGLNKSIFLFWISQINTHQIEACVLSSSFYLIIVNKISILQSWDELWIYAWVRIKSILYYDRFDEFWSLSLQIIWVKFNLEFVTFVAKMIKEYDILVLIESCFKVAFSPVTVALFANKVLAFINFNTFSIIFDLSLQPFNCFIFYGFLYVLVNIFFFILDKLLWVLVNPLIIIA